MLAPKGKKASLGQSQLMSTNALQPNLAQENHAIEEPLLLKVKVLQGRNMRSTVMAPVPGSKEAAKGQAQQPASIGTSLKVAFADFFEPKDV